MEKNYQQDEKWRKQPLSAVLFCIIGALINIAGSSIAVRFKLPVFLDSIGTILTAAFGGYLPGIAVGYLTNVINGISDITNAYYAVINVLLAVLAAFFEKKGYFKKISTTVFAILCFAVVGGGLGSILTYYIYGFNIGEGISAPFATYIYDNLIHSIFFAQLLADMAIDVIDKTITVVIVLIIMHLIPKSLRPLIHFYGWQQTPLSDDERAKVSSQNTRGLSLQHKIMIIISAAILFIASCTVGISFVLYHKAIIAEYSSTCESVAALAVSVVDGNRVDEFLEKGTDAHGYGQTLERLYAIKKANDHIKFLYVYKIEENGCTVVFDLESKDENGNVIEPSSPGDKIDFDPTFMKYVPKLLRGEEIPAVISNDSYGWLLTFYKPVYDRYNNCVCYAAADISMNHITLDEISFLVRSVSLFFAFYFLIIAIGLWLAEYNVILPINTMSSAAEDFAFNTEMEREKSVSRFKSLGINTGDEIERLYNSFSKTIAETDEYIEDIQNKGKLIAKMQNGLILVLADIVESRDKCTGDHIKKTAAYTRIIMDHLREMGKYTAILTDEYIEDVVNSAPLHDIGKIKIPDSILNTPGKLTDEEFDIMKTHTTAGAEIIDGAMELVSESGYLKEAKNLAYYHHEKWNGKGYPKGLKETEIPLSARIMAVADVFDALVSRRSYKEPFTFEKAMSIIIEGSGNHFEPDIVDAFVAAKDEVRTVAEMNMKSNDFYH
ncbi:MAG: HD domain-containing protein [Firmicutes bacterium]|nr:HD domain-containing protein [Bacillota bacterium]